MATKWKQLNEQESLLSRLAKLAIRAQRLLVAQRINSLNAMAQSHGKTLTRQPGGKEKLKQVRRQLAQLKTVLIKGGPRG